MKFTKEQFIYYYQKGLRDSEIAKILKVCASSIGEFRRSLNLPTNHRHVCSDEEILEQYKKGFTDAEISRILNISTSQVARRRKKFNLSKNERPNKLDNCFINLYNKNMNDREISKITGVSKSVVQKYRSSLNLKSIGKHSVNKNEIKKLILNGKSDKEIGDIFGLSYLTIKRHRQNLGFIQKSSRPNKYKYDDTQSQIIIGSILGDASLVKMHKNGGTVFKITHCLKQQDYLKYKWGFLKENASTIKEYFYTDKRLKVPFYSNKTFYTKSSTSLNEMFNNWYRPKKRIYKPDLFKLNPLGLSIWYCDDGYLSKDGGCFLCTNSFPIEDLKIIQLFFKEKFNIIVNIYTKLHLIYFPKKESFKFQKLILPYIIDSMKYKIHKSLLNSVKQENSKLDNPVLNHREIDEKAKRLDVIPNEKDEDIKSSTKAGHCSE